MIALFYSKLSPWSVWRWPPSFVTFFHFIYGASKQANRLTSKWTLKSRSNRFTRVTRCQKKKVTCWPKSTLIKANIRSRASPPEARSGLSIRTREQLSAIYIHLSWWWKETLRTLRRLIWPTKTLVSCLKTTVRMGLTVSTLSSLSFTTSKGIIR